MTVIARNVLQDNYVEQLYDLFEKKNWIREELGSYSVFDRFCERLAELETDVQRDLILELTADFLWIDSGMYEQCLLRAFCNLFKDASWKPEKEKNIYISPLLPEKDFGKVKSSTFLLYLCQSILLRTYEEFQNGQVRICETPELLQEKVHKERMDAVILIDDFIGSGETALESIAYLNALKQEGKKLFIVALVAQEEGIKNIQKEGVPVFADIIRKRGISDRFEEAEAKKKLEEMEKISRQLQAPSEMYLGYLKSESLVAMNKTPNNTFPVYWYEKKRHSRAPFPRKENVKVIRKEKHEEQEKV